MLCIKSCLLFLGAFLAVTAKTNSTKNISFLLIQHFYKSLKLYMFVCQLKHLQMGQRRSSSSTLGEVLVHGSKLN